MVKAVSSAGINALVGFLPADLAKCMPVFIPAFTAARKAKKSVGASIAAGGVGGFLLRAPYC